MKAKCMGCSGIHPSYEFVPGQMCYLLWCGHCGTRMHEPVAAEQTNAAELLTFRVELPFNNATHSASGATAKKPQSADF